MLKRAGLLFLIIAALSIPASLAGCDVELVTGSGQDVTWEMDYSDFNKIKVSHAFEIEITRADTFFVEITVDETLNEYLKINRRSDTLYIGLKSGREYVGMTRRAVVTMPELQRLELSGASAGTVSGFASTRSIDFDLSGASTLAIDDMRADKSRFGLSGASEATGRIMLNEGDFDLSGASSLSLEGSADHIRVRGSGVSDFKLFSFPVATADVDLSGGSRAEINVSDLMDINLSGASDVVYMGNPKLGSIDMSGGSTINPR